jgi:hypothetical protein
LAWTKSILGLIGSDVGVSDFKLGIEKLCRPVTEREYGA